MDSQTKQNDVQGHTPGPWDTVDGAILCKNVNAYGNFHIARFDRGDEPITDEDRANARLITAAPDLLAALELCLPFVDAVRRMSGGDGDATAMQARAAIAKARGQQ